MWKTGGVDEMYAFWKCDFGICEIMGFVDLIYAFAHTDRYRRLDGLSKAKIWRILIDAICFEK